MAPFSASAHPGPFATFALALLTTAQIAAQHPGNPLDYLYGEDRLTKLHAEYAEVPGEHERGFLGYRVRDGGLSEIERFDARAINGALYKHFHEAGHWRRAAEYRDEFHQTGYVAPRAILPPYMHAFLLQRVSQLFEDAGSLRKDPNIYSGTARKLTSLDNRTLRKKLSITKELYRSPVMLTFESMIFNTKTQPLHKRFELDHFVAHLKRTKGDQLGPHIDPSMGSTVMILRAPPKGVGGNIAFCRPPEGSPRLADAAQVRSYLRSHRKHISTRSPESNSMYFIATADCPHWTLPLKRDLLHGEERINLTFRTICRISISATKPKFSTSIARK